MNSLILWVILAIVAIFIIGWLVQVFKASKDPDVIEASNLRMDVRRFRHYREGYDEFARLMKVYGSDSKEAMEYFKTVDNPNEWRRYQAYRHQQWKAEWEKEKERIWNGEK